MDATTKRVSTVRHKLTNCEVKVPGGLIVDNSLTLKANYCQQKAIFQKGPHKYRCIDFFKEGGPSNMKQLVSESPDLRMLVDKVVAARAARLEPAEKAAPKQDLGDDFQEALKVKAKEATKRAREALDRPA